MTTSGSLRIAERYVKALLDVSGENVLSDFEAIDKALSENAELRTFLSNPLLGRDQQAAAIDAVLEKMRASTPTRQFVAMLARQKRLEILADIIALYRDKVTALRGEINAEIVAANELSGTQVREIADRLSKAYGKKVHVTVKQDPALLGGMIVRIGSVQLDASLAGKLDRLSLKLKAA